ncbi:adenylosuccinate lyase [Bdellovibrionota bacterium]
MISRYTRPQLADLWSAENRFRTWLRVEILASEAMAREGLVPHEAVEEIKSKASFSVSRIDEIEKTVKHDVIAFLTSVSEYVGEAARYLHFGLTSSDILDTSLAVLLKEASEIILKDLEELKEALKGRAEEHKHTVMIGRSHGMHAEPTTFGLKCALWYAETERNIERLKAAKERISVGKLSGAVGTFAHLPPSIEEYVCEALDLKPEPIATQVIQRDRHAEFFSVLAVIGSTHEKISTEIRHLQRTELGEAEEFFSPGQKGSSAMPHKRNPIASENMTGLARLLRGYAVSAMENNALWHERDISHSSVERVIAPDATTILDYQTARLTKVIKTLVVYPEKMKQNLELSRGRIFSQKLLLELAKRGVTREAAYEIVQRNAMILDKDFEENLLNDNDLKKFLTEEEIKSVCDVRSYLNNVDILYQRIFG